MATRLKTIKYCFANSGPTVVASNTAQTIAKTIYIPESSKVFKSVGMTGFANLNRGAVTDTPVRLLSCQVGANTPLSLNLANRLTNSGEHNPVFVKQDMTVAISSFWGADTTSDTVTCTQQYNIHNSTDANAFTNGNMELDITYEYDDTSATKIKTVMIPLNCPVVNVTTSNTTYDTIPALDTYLPEASKTYRNIYIVVQGNVGGGANANLHILAGATGHTCAQIPNNLVSDQWFRVIAPFDALNTSTTHNFQLGSSVAKMSHLQAWMVVTYEYNEASTTSIMNSLMLPMELTSPAGRAAADYQRGTREFWIQEPGTITTNRVAFYAFWNQSAAVAGLNMRIGTGSFTGYSDAAGVLCGNNGAMCRNDSAFTLTRGRNELNFDVYRTDTADFMWNLCGFWLINYTSSKPTAGSDAGNRTVIWNINAFGTGASAQNASSTFAPSIPESNYFLSAVGTQAQFMSNATTIIAGTVIRFEKTAAEGGVEWLPAYVDIQQSDPELGLFTTYSQMRSSFRRFPNDHDSNRLDFETSRRWEFHQPSGAQAATGWQAVDIIATYHTLIYNVAGTTANSAGGNVVLHLCRTGSGEVVLSQNVAANASFNFTWYDNTEPVFVEAVGDNGKYARSADDYAAV